MPISSGDPNIDIFRLSVRVVGCVVKIFPLFRSEVHRVRVLLVLDAVNCSPKVDVS
jgi:hypothetical protein